jgi:carbamoyl-phosphate synthase large subunit
METKTVIVTGIGGNVGQGILRNIRNLNWPVRIVGLDVASFNAGVHLCDVSYKVPYSYDDGYTEAVRNIAFNENVDLIIPSTDHEVYYLALYRDEIPAPIAASEKKLAFIFLDKYETYKYLRKLGISFAKSWLPHEYDFSEKNIIAKPREGKGSRGIIINPENPAGLSDDYLIQKLYAGNEITSAIYASKNKKLHGCFTMERFLSFGTTIKSRVLFDFDDKVKEIASSIINAGGVYGSFNIQSIVTDQKEVIPFEINCRISGTNSIRHNLGFQDVKYTLQEYLFNVEPDQPAPVQGIATRILMDVVYPGAIDYSEINNKSSQHIIY